MKKSPVWTLVVVLFIQLVFVFAAEPRREKENPLSGRFEYSAFYETGSKAGTWTRNHAMSIDFQDGDYDLNWGSLRVKTRKVANGLIYEWKLGPAHGEGIYLFYKNNTRLFGSFRLTDENGEHCGYTEGEKMEDGRD